MGVLIRAASRALPLLLLAACAGTRPPLRVAVISDLNEAYGATVYGAEVGEAVRRIREEWRPDLVLAAGDLVAGQRPTLTDREVRAMWAAFDSVVAGPLRGASIPFGFALGNHDASRYPAHSRDRRLALEHWSDPARDPGLDFVDRRGFPFNYSFRAGGAFFLVWDATNEETGLDPRLLAWAEAQLASEPSRAARHRVVLGHLPLRAVAVGRNLRGEVLAEPARLIRLLARHHVHLYVSGHHHAYFPGRIGSLELLHAGALGQTPRPLLSGERPPERTITLVTLAADSIVYATFALEEGGARLRPIPLAELPEVMVGIHGPVWRRDRAPRRSP